MQAASSMQSTPQSQSHTLPIKQVTLYKNNLAFLKRTGKVSTAQLEIAESIKDLVTSTLSVASQASVSVLFGGQKQVVNEPEYGFQYGTRSNLGAFLDSLIGPPPSASCGILTLGQHQNSFILMSCVNI